MAELVESARMFTTSIYPPTPRYAIPPYLVTKDLRDGSYLPPYLSHTVCVLALLAELAELAALEKTAEKVRFWVDLGPFSAQKSTKIAKTEGYFDAFVLMVKEL